MITIKIKQKKRGSKMSKVVSLGTVHTHTHTCNFIKEKQAIRVALLNIDIKQNKLIVSL